MLQRYFAIKKEKTSKQPPVMPAEEEFAREHLDKVSAVYYYKGKPLCPTHLNQGKSPPTWISSLDITINMAG